MKYPRINLGPITAAQIQAYAEASGDHNPIHLDEEFAVSAGLEGRIAHGMLSMGLASRALEEWGMELSSLQHFNSKFKDKVYIGENIFAEKIVETRTEKGFQLQWRLCKEDGSEILSAEAIFA